MPLTAHIRPATVHDADVLPAIEQSAARAFRSIKDLSWLADGDVMTAAEHRVIISASTCWVAVDDQDRLQAFLSAQCMDHELHIHELSVRHEHQGQGIGRSLVLAAIQWAADQALRAVTLTTFRDVPWNQPFYARLGFVTLDNDHLDERLGEILENEQDQGFCKRSRCAMMFLL
ncbi:acetyltransferase [compost metagenome]